MAQTIKTISLLLSAKKGIKDNYKLILNIFDADSETGLPLNELSPLATIERDVKDIDHEDWYSFILDNDLNLNNGYYCLSLKHEYIDEVDKTTNFVEWLNSDIDEDNNITRCFKIYEDFNNINYISNSSQYLNIKAPKSIQENLLLENRQDFIIAEKNNIDICGDNITLADPSGRIYATNLSLNKYFNELEWSESNFNLPNNDINSFSIYNLTNNKNQNKCIIGVTPKYSGLSLSADSGASWESFYNIKIGTTNENIVRNFSVIKIDNNYCYVFDNTNDSENGKCFIANIQNTDDIIDRSLSFTEFGRLTNNGNGLIVNCSYVYDNKVYVGTNHGLYVSQSLTTANWQKFQNITFDININDIIFDTYFYIATNSGCYRFDSSWILLGDNEIWNNCTANCLNTTNNKLYIGTSKGLYRSIKNNGVYEQLEGYDLSGTFLPQGLYKSKITSIGIGKKSESRIYIAQQGGVFISENEGGNFSLLSTNLPEKKVNSLLVNPVNENILYVLTETTKFTNSAITFLMDSSGSMVSSDPNNTRLLSAKKIVNEIESNALSVPYWQIIEFGLPEASSVNKPGYNYIKNIDDLINFPGANILTKSSEFTDAELIASGFTSSAITTKNIIDSCIGGTLNRTPLFDAINATAMGLNNYGAYWEYDYDGYMYRAGKIFSEYFTQIHKALIIFTDGNDTVYKNIIDLEKDLYKYENNKSLLDSNKIKIIEDLINKFSKVQSDIYIVGIGNNINYENLRSLKNLHKYVKIYFANYDEMIYSGESTNSLSDFLDGNVDYLDIADKILSKEKTLKRTGTWTKKIIFEDVYYIDTIDLNYNFPPQTTGKIRYRTSNDNSIWSDWTQYIDINSNLDVNLKGMYLEIQIKLESNNSLISPEIKSLNINYKKPSVSKLFYKSINTNNPISEFYLTSIDSLSTNELNRNDVNIDYIYIDGDKINTVNPKQIEINKRNVVKRKNIEKTTTKNGYFYFVENGPWASDLSVKIYLDDKLVNENEFMLIPEQGIIYFYNQQINNNKYNDIKISIIRNNSYRVGSIIKNYTNTDKDIKYHDIAWNYFYPESSTTYRKPLPYVSSQLNSNEYYGLLQNNYLFASRGITNEIILQYLPKEKMNDCYLSFTTGELINNKLFSQNTYLSKYNISDESKYSFVSTRINDTKINDLTLTVLSSDLWENQNLHYAVNIPIKTLNKNETLNIVIGDSGSSSGNGTFGIPSILKLNNILTSTDENIIGEFETSFIFKKENPVTSSINDYKMKLYPKLNIGGKSAKNIEIILPTKIRPSDIFTMVVLPIDNNGLIDYNFEGEIELELFGDNIIELNHYSVKFIKEDNGIKKINGFSISGQEGVARVLANFKGSTVKFKSNPILVYDDNVVIKWGDLNVSSLFSDGRQNIEFIANYAKNISNLDFICITDDLDYIKPTTNDGESVWNYIIKSTKDNSNGNFIIYPGFRYRMNSNYGEHAVFFVDDNNIPETMIANPANQGSNPVTQINNLINGLYNYNYISFVVHPSYDNFKYSTEIRKKMNIFKNRSMNYNNYKPIKKYAGIKGNDFILNRELLTEIYSEHGEFENKIDGLLSCDNLIEDPNYYVRKALEIGKKFGFIASSGGYSSRPGYYTGDAYAVRNYPNIKYLNDYTSNKGLTAVISTSNDRYEIFNDLKKMKTYATTGARFYLDYSASCGSYLAKIGETIYFNDDDIDVDNKPKYEIQLNIRIVSDKSPLSTIKIIRIEVETDSIEIYKVVLTGENVYDYALNFIDNKITCGYYTIMDRNVNNKDYCYYIIAEQEDNHRLYSSPIWFNFGRIDGISALSDGDATDIKMVEFLPQTDNKDFNGVFSATADQNSPIATFNNNYNLPSAYSSPLSLISNKINSAIRKTYKNACLYVSDNTMCSNGYRVLAKNGKNIIYGSHGLRFIANDTDLQTMYIGGSNGVNSISALSQNTSYKFLEDWGPYYGKKDADTAPAGSELKNKSWITSTINMRSKLFGYMLSFSNNESHVKYPYILDNVAHLQNGQTEISDVYQPTNKIQIVRDPFIIDIEDKYGMVYVGFDGQEYPDTTLGIRNIDYNQDNNDYDKNLGRIEDFAGLLDSNLSDNKFKLYFNLTENNNLKNFGQPLFSFNQSFIDQNNTLKSLLYPSSPNLLNDGDNFKLYYIAWVKESDQWIPFMVCNVFDKLYSETENYLNSNINNTYLSFMFNDATEVPPYYSLRKCSTKNIDLAWGHFANDLYYNKSNPYYLKNIQNWPTTHPAYGIGFTWLSVTKDDNDVYYAFFNRNQTRSADGIIKNEKGTGVLYSLDGINFYEYDISNTMKINDMDKKLFVHVFKSGGQWMMSYVDTDSSAWSNGLAKVKYNAFIWSSMNNFSPKI